MNQSGKHISQICLPDNDEVGRFNPACRQAGLGSHIAFNYLFSMNHTFIFKGIFASIALYG
ncbi:hypothetical protein COB55_01880 [Candidatus Wolfebacteria bacterium]|nr:MAG: hypothetical protein COB55_01880 [Candidatus Wolfebacteria bacterium]